MMGKEKGMGKDEKGEEEEEEKEKGGKDGIREKNWKG